MLEGKDTYWPLLRCPRTGLPLRAEGDRLVAADPSDDACSYPAVDGKPVLVDFARSILDEAATLESSARSVVPRTRRRGLARIVKAMLDPAGAITRANVRVLIDQLKAAHTAPRVLVVGGGTLGQDLLPLYEDPSIRVLAFDIYDSPEVQFIADAHRIPLVDACCDGCVVQAVLEHVLEPAEVVAEIARVLRPDGLVYADTPFLQHVHEGPYDFTRFTESGHRYLFRDFELLRSGATAGLGTQAAWTMEHLGRGLCRSVAAGKAVKLLFFWLKYLDRLIPEPYAVDGASGVYFLGRKATRRISPKDIVTHYKGAQRPFN